MIKQNKLRTTQNQTVIIPLQSYFSIIHNIKIFEQNIDSEPTNYLNAIETISHLQFGLKSKRFTTRQLLRLTERINNGFKKKINLRVQPL